MGIDWIVHRACEPKRVLGDREDGDGALRGTAALLDALKARARAVTLREITEREGADFETQEFTVTLSDADGLHEKAVTGAGLEAQAAVLDGLAGPCASCPANALGQDFGCVGFVAYPIPAASEEWLLGRLPAAETFGGRLVLNAMRDFKWRGRAVKAMRRQGFFENETAPRRVLGRGLFRAKSVDANQLWEAVLFVGEALGPDHCLGLLLWLDALAIEGRPIRSADDGARFATLASLETEDERFARTHVEVGPASENPAVADMQALLRGLHAAWATSQPLLLSA